VAGLDERGELLKYRLNVMPKSHDVNKTLGSAHVESGCGHQMALASGGKQVQLANAYDT
jgi:hypothetical protein